jgi:hypothetical protein
MKNRARNKTELAARLGYGRNTLYTFMRLPNFPSPDAQGRWNIAACRKFILRQSKRVAGPAEKDRLGLALMELKVRRAEQELTGFESELRAKILDEFVCTFEAILRVTKIELHRAIDKLGQYFGNREICKVGRKLIEKALGKSVVAVQEKTGVTVKENVLPFHEETEANGNGQETTRIGG